MKMTEYSEYEKWHKILKKLNNLINSKKYFMDVGRDAYSYFWFLDEDVSREFEKVRKDFMTDERGRINFMEWFIHDAEIEDGKTLIDIAIEEGIFSEDEMEIVERMKKSNYSLYEIERIKPGEGFIIKDLLEENIFEVKEKKASEGLVKWDIVGIRLIELDGLYRMTGALYIFRPLEREIILRGIRKDFNHIKKSLGIKDMSQYLKLRGGEVLNYFFIAFNSKKTIIRNTDGELMVISRSEYIVMDYENVIANLSDNKELKEIGKNNFEWLSPSKTVLAIIKLKKGKLIIECNSRERLAKTKKFLKKALKYCKFVKNEFQDVSERIGDVGIYNIFEEGPLNKKEEEFMRTMFREQLLEWLDTEIPILGGLTPREAVKREKEREKLIDIIKDLENQNERRKLFGGLFYDFSLLWEELGLKEYLYLKQ